MIKGEAVWSHDSHVSLHGWNYIKESGNAGYQSIPRTPSAQQPMMVVQPFSLNGPWMMNR